MRVLVTGGAGFIGSTTAAALLRAGHAVTVLDDLSTGRRRSVPTAARFVQGDLRDRGCLEAVVGGDTFDACVHFAGLIEAGASMREPARYFAVNTGGSALLLEVLVRHGVERFVLSSTAAVYGDHGGALLTEDAELRPTNAYGESKYLVERMLGWQHRLHGLKVASLRYFNAAGAVVGHPERHVPETHLIPRLLQVATGRRDAIEIYGNDYPTPDGTAVRDYVHVADLASAHVRALERLDELGRVTVNLGNGRGFSVREVVQAVRDVTGHDVPSIDVPRRHGDPAILVASAARARRLLDWEPEHPHLRSIVSDAWDSHRATEMRQADAVR